MYGMIDKDHTIMSGINSRLDEIQAAMLSVKLKYLDKMNEDRNKVAQNYIKNLPKDLLVNQFIPNNIFCNYHVFSARFKGNRDKFLKFLTKKAIWTNIYYPVPLHLQEALSFLGYKKHDFPQTEELCMQVIALPMYSHMPLRIQDEIIAKINSYQEKN